MEKSIKNIIETQGKNRRNQCKFNENRELTSGTMKKSTKTIEKTMKTQEKDGRQPGGPKKNK